MTIKEQIAEKIFPFQLYISGKFNHSDIIEAMVTMTEIFESLYGQSLIGHLDIKPVEHQGSEPTANDEI